jgi:hypothetical protein
MGEVSSGREGELPRVLVGEDCTAWFSEIGDTTVEEGGVAPWEEAGSDGEPDFGLLPGKDAALFLCGGSYFRTPGGVESLE